MEKAIGAFDVRRQFGKILQQVAVRAIESLSSGTGSPWQWWCPWLYTSSGSRPRQAFLESLEQMTAGANLPAEEAEELIARELRRCEARANEPGGC